MYRSALITNFGDESLGTAQLWLLSRRGRVVPPVGRTLAVLAVLILLPVAALLLVPPLLSAQAEPGTPQVRGNPDAVLGGMRRERFSVQPAQLHPLNATDYYGNVLLDRIYETLAQTDVETQEHIPLLAERWEVSADTLSYTFHLNPAARWQDGKPVSAEDVAFSYTVLTHAQLKTRAKWQSYYANVAEVTVLDARTVRFRMRKDHFHNFINLAGLRIVPKHGFPGDDPNTTPLTKNPMGSGPYAFVNWKKGASLQLRRVPDYWGRGLPQNVGRHNQELLLTKIIATDKVALETLKKGDLDVMALTPEQWVKESDGARFGLGVESGKPLIKLDVVNKEPRPYRYVGWNLESPLFSDRRVRRAMSHLFDRDTTIAKFYHGLQDKAVGPFEVGSRYSSPKVRPIEFSVSKAIALLRDAGWSDSDGDQLLDKDGRALRFTILTADPETSVKVLTLTKENMRKAGVEMNIKVVDWATLLALIDEYRYDAVMLGWSRASWPDPTALWHSESAVQGGLNLVRYKNPEVDRLIEQGVRTIPDAQRVLLFRRIHEILYEDQPYTFLTERSHELLVYRAGFRAVKPWFAYAVGEDYWWLPAPVR